MKKKKILIPLILAICLIIPLIVVFATCGGKSKGGKTTVTTVTAEEWVRAISFEGIDNYSAESIYSSDSGEQLVWQRDGAKVYYKNAGYESVSNSIEIFEVCYNKIVTESGDTYEGYNRWNGDEGKWRSITVNAESYEPMLNYFPLLFATDYPILDMYDSFKYNEELKAYVAVDEDGDVGDCIIKFADGLMTEIVIDGTRLVFSYNSAQITIPTVE